MTGRGIAVLLVASALALGGCGGSDSSAPSAGPSESTTATSSSSAPSSPATSTVTSAPTSAPTTGATKPPIPRDTIKVPRGVKVTHEGTHKRFGERATVAWRPKQGVVGVIVVRVTGVERVSLQKFHDYVLDTPTRRSTPYFVHGTVANIGHTDLSGYAVPLYLLDGRGTLVEPSSFRAKFKPCRSRPFPKTFTHGVRIPVCLVYFAPRHGRAKAVSFRPSQHYSAITWRGRIHQPRS